VSLVEMGRDGNGFGAVGGKHHALVGTSLKGAEGKLERRLLDATEQPGGIWFVLDGECVWCVGEFLFGWEFDTEGGCGDTGE
jgi:hypothetical protein